ncbi:MAG: hypothetical protein FJY91_00310 [Candidatus Harrisonbacteria bacterium]|nr:hypothetical protein [Candidatus Harrisonbacteria bacterium]
MIFLLYGTDSYKKEENLQVIVSEFKRRHGNPLTINFFDDKNTDLESELLSHARSQSLFSAPRALILREPFALKKDALLIPIFKQAIDDPKLILILVSEAAPDKKLSFLLEKPVVVKSYEIPEGKAWLDYVLREMKKRGVEPKKGIERTLATYFVGDPWGLVTELDKLSLGASLGNYELDTAGLFNQIFSLRPSARSPRSRLATLYKLLKKEDAAKVFNLLAYQKGGLPKSFFAHEDVLIKLGKTDHSLSLLKAIL